MSNLQLPEPYQPPAYFQNYKFKVEIDGVFSAAFSRVTGISMRVDTVPYRVGTDASTAPSDVPGLTNYDRITFSRGVVGDYDMLDWIWSVCAGDYAPTGMRTHRNITLTILRPDGTDGPRWFLGNVLPVAYRMDDLNSMDGEVLLESLEVSCGTISREVVGGYENIQREQKEVPFGYNGQQWNGGRR